MTNQELAKKVLAKEKSRVFPCYLSVSEGGPCSGGWEDDSEILVPKRHLLYLLKKETELPSELFDGLIVKEVDLDKRMEQMACDAAFCEFGEDEDTDNYSIFCEIRDYALNGYITARAKMLYMILNGEITKKQISVCEEFFNDSKYLEEEGFDDGSESFIAWFNERCN